MRDVYEHKRSTWHLIQRFWPYERKYLKTVLLDLFCAALTCLCDLVLPLILRTITNLAMTDLAALTVSLVLKLGYTYYSNTKIGQIMGRITNDLFDVTEFAHHCPEEFFIAGLKFVVSFIILCTYNVALTVIIFACVPLMTVVSIKLNHWQREAFRRQRVQIGELNAQIEDSLLGERVVKAFGVEEREKAKFTQGNQEL